MKQVLEGVESREEELKVFWMVLDKNAEKCFSSELGYTSNNHRHI